MRLLFFIITLLVASSFILVGYLTFIGKISFALYILLSTLALVLLTFLSGHYIYHYHFRQK